MRTNRSLKDKNKIYIKHRAMAETAGMQPKLADCIATLLLSRRKNFSIFY